MPIFGRRQLQLMFDDLGPWLAEGKAKDLLNRLENEDSDQALPAEYELSLTWAISRMAALEIDKGMGSRNPDIYSPDLLATGTIAADIAAVSDVSLSGMDVMRRARNIINVACNEIRKNASSHLHYTFQEENGYVPDGKGRSKFFRSRLVSRDFQIDASLRAALEQWLHDGQPSQPLRWKAQHIDVIISWRDYVHASSSTFCSMPSLAYDLRDNPLYRVLKTKSKQLRQVPAGVRRAVFLGDAGCSLLRDLQPAGPRNHTFSGRDIIQAFLTNDRSIDLVVVFAVKRRHELSLNSLNNPRVWRTYVFDQREVIPDGDLSRLTLLADSLPAPYLNGYEARSWHEQGMFSPKARGHFLPTTMSIGRESMTVRISARAVQELMAGKLTPEQFQRWIFGENNPIDRQLAAGCTISNVRFESKGADADDDYLTFDFKEDPAATRLRLPPSARSSPSPS